jgi:quinolinate synthase
LWSNFYGMKSLQEKLIALKKAKNAVILAHYYQEPAIQDILFAGVHFMAETAKILNPSKKVILPDVNAGCSLADSCPPEAFQAFKAQHPNHLVITYVNCSAEIKALSDIVCTSSNALKIVASLPVDQPIIFAPDKNLGHYINAKTGRNMLLWDGSCVVHEAFSLDKLLTLYKEHPDAKIVAHPESEAHILETANYIGSTAGMIDFVKKDPNSKFIIATEAGILHKMTQEVPDKILIPAPSIEDNTCACSECAFMKVNTLQKVYDCLLNESPEIIVPETIRQKALLPIERMLKLSL